MPCKMRLPTSSRRIGLSPEGDPFDLQLPKADSPVPSRSALDVMAARVERLAVMYGGSIVESGTHAELLARQGQYALLHSLQFKA